MISSLSALQSLSQIRVNLVEQMPGDFANAEPQCGPTIIAQLSAQTKQPISFATRCLTSGTTAHLLNDIRGTSKSPPENDLRQEQV
jgi:hypothetical protein